MTLPAILFSILISTFIGALFHLWRGGNAGRLLLYLVLSWLGFSTGQILGRVLGWTFWSVGPIHMGMACLVCFIFMGAGYWLSLVKPDVPENNKPLHRPAAKSVNRRIR
jgi:hypothetical protein